jgi:hypothetical protein
MTLRRFQMSQDEQKSTGQSGQGSDYMSREDCRAMRRQFRYRDPLRGVLWAGALVLIGILFLASNFYGINFTMWWPVILIIIGAVGLTRYFIRNQN